MLTHSDALVANTRFYEAFRGRDAQAMEQLWARTHDCFCLHPGWAALTGRDTVVESWNRILSNAASPEVFVYGEEIVASGNCIFVLCYEVMDQAILVASNGFVEEDGHAVMVSHQSGQCAEPPEPPTLQ